MSAPTTPLNASTKSQQPSVPTTPVATLNSSSPATTPIVVPKATIIEAPKVPTTPIEKVVIEKVTPMSVDTQKDISSKAEVPESSQGLKRSRDDVPSIAPTFDNVRPPIHHQHMVKIFQGHFTAICFYPTKPHLLIGNNSHFYSNSF
jgi:hypothetical protein